MAGISKMAGALSPPEFKHALARFPRLSDKGRAVAQAILVDGATFDEVAARYGVSRQMAHEWASKIYEVFRPQGWVTESVTLPPELMAKVRQMEADARAQWERSLNPPRIVRR